MDQHEHDQHRTHGTAAVTPDPDHRTAAPPSGQSRRRFLTAAGVGTLSAGVLSTVGLPVAASAAPADGDTEGVATGDAVVAYVADLRRGEITVMSGDREVTVTDPALARSIARKVR